MLENFRNNLKKIFESTEKIFTEEDVNKKEFIHTTPDGIVYKVDVDPTKGEFCVYDKNGKQIDMFNMALVNTDGAILKNVRQAIVDQYKGLDNAGMGSDELGDEVKVAEENKKTAITQKLPAIEPSKSKEDSKTAVTQRLEPIKKVNEEAPPVDKKNAETVRMEKPKSQNDIETVKITKPNEVKKE